MIPQFSSVVVEPSKLTAYCLNATHRLGRHKARGFREQLGINAADADLLRMALINAVE